MGQCASQPAVVVNSHDEPLNKGVHKIINTRPELSARDSSVTVATALLEDGSVLDRSILDRSALDKSCTLRKSISESAEPITEDEEEEESHSASQETTTESTAEEEPQQEQQQVQQEAVQQQQQAASKEGDDQAQEVTKTQKLAPQDIHPHAAGANHPGLECSWVRHATNAKKKDVAKKEQIDKKISPEAQWLKEFSRSYGGEDSNSSASQMSAWSSELLLEDSMSSLGDRSEMYTSSFGGSSKQPPSLLDSHATHEPSGEESFSSVIPPVEESLSSVLPTTKSVHSNHHNYSTKMRRCSHASDPMTSWSDLNTSLSPACSSVRRGESYESFSDMSASTGTTASSRQNSVFKRRRDSAASIGTLSSWGGLNTSSAVNPYGRSSAATQNRLRDASPTRASPNRPFGRRYSMTPSVDTVSEGLDRSDEDVHEEMMQDRSSSNQDLTSINDLLDDDDDWNDSNLTSLLSLDPQELQQRAALVAES